MNSRAIEQFLARLYTDGEALRRFLAVPREEARRAGLGEAECDALTKADMTGLQMAAQSFAGKRDSQDWNPLVYRTAEAEPKEGAYDGEMLWNELIRKHQGIFLVLSGHVLNDGEGALTSVGDHGNLVHQMLSNYQMLDEGGLGYLRLLELRPDGRTLRVKTYSPSLDLFATDPAQDFRLEINPPLGALSH